MLLLLSLELAPNAEFDIKLNIIVKAFLNLRWIQVSLGLVLYQEVCFDNTKSRELFGCDMRNCLEPPGPRPM